MEKKLSDIELYLQWPIIIDVQENNMEKRTLYIIHYITFLIYFTSFQTLSKQLSNLAIVWQRLKNNVIWKIIWRRWNLQQQLNMPWEIGLTEIH